MEFFFLTQAYLAQTPDPSASLWLSLVNLGAVGLVLFLFLTGRLHSEKSVQRMIAAHEAAMHDQRAAHATAMAACKAERDDAVADARHLRDTMIEQAVPAITRVTEATVRATEALLRGPSQ